MAKEILLPLLNCGLQSPPPFRKQIDQKLWKLVTNIVLSHYRFMRFRKKKRFVVCPKKWRNWQRGKSSHLLFRRFHIYCNKTKSPKKGKETQSGKRRDKSRTHLMNYNANWVASKMLRSNAALACVEFIPGLSDESSRTPFFLAEWVWAASEEGRVSTEEWGRRAPVATHQRSRAEGLG